MFFLHLNDLTQCFTNTIWRVLSDTLHKSSKGIYLCTCTYAETIIKLFSDAKTFSIQRNVNEIEFMHFLNWSKTCKCAAIMKLIEHFILLADANCTEIRYCSWADGVKSAFLWNKNIFTLHNSWPVTVFLINTKRRAEARFNWICKMILFGVIVSSNWKQAHKDVEELKMYSGA